ncbi:hypothetical protein I4U23_025137 [Adineta vaga]|nr:hypothetical protein I4U23_025137 [Adineta vaga]
MAPMTTPTTIIHQSRYQSRDDDNDIDAGGSSIVRGNGGGWFESPCAAIVDGLFASSNAAHPNAKGYAKIGEVVGAYLLADQ